MTNQSEDKARELALKRCTDLIDWYKSQKGTQRALDNILQTSVILAAGLTAFAAAIDSWPKWAIVLPAVITTVATGLSANFGFRTKYVNFASAGERLKWVKLRYQIRSESAPDDPKHLEDFVNSMEAIVSAELAEWREGLLAGDIAGKKTPAAGEDKQCFGTHGLNLRFQGTVNQWRCRWAPAPEPRRSASAHGFVAAKHV